MGKELDEKKQDSIIKKNAFLSIIFKGLVYLLSFFTAPLLLSCLGDYKYGVYVTTLSMISWIYYFDFGIGSGLKNKLTECLTLGDYKKAKNYVNVSYILVSLISIAAFVIVFVISFFFDFESLLNINLSDESLNLIILIAVFFACINFVLTLGVNILHSLQKTGLASGFDIVSKITMLLALIIYKLFNIKAMMAIVVIEGAAQLIKNIIAVCYIYITAKEVSPDFRNVDFKSSREILDFGIKIFFMQISALILNSTDNLIITRFFGAEAVTPYSMCHKYFTIINAFFTAAVTPLWPAYTRLYTLKDVKHIKKTLNKSLLFYAGTFLLIIIALIVFKPFMRIYLGKNLAYQPGLIALVALYYALLIFSHNFSSFVHAISKVRITTIACIIGAVLNIPASIYLAVHMDWGINGVLLGSIISLIITTTAYIYTTIKEIKKLGEKIA